MLSAVAGIVDRKGGLRVVVTQRWRMRHHVKRNERLYVVPDLEVQEPVPWNEVPPLIEKVQKHVVSTIAPENKCGSCTACCKTLYIKDGRFEKPSGALCNHCDVGFGCKLYQGRPKVCKTFKCWWLKSQSRNDKMPKALRPDNCGTIFTENNDPLIIESHGEPNAVAWGWINSMQAAGYKVRKITHYTGEGS